MHTATTIAAAPFGSPQSTQTAESFIEEIAMTTTSRTTSTIAVLVSALAVACGAEQTHPTHPATPIVRTAPKPPPPQAATKPKPSTSSNIAISDEIRKACGIPVEDAYFAFDSARIRQRDQHVLDALATCFSTGPLRERTMDLVGHCDPRGDAEYNMLLGDRRAQSVKDYIETRGLTPSRMQTSSRGEMDATGYDEATWALDRRVDVMLAPRGQAANTGTKPAASHPS
jgi:peptidoglycan-associated lipoprotein